MHQSPSSPSNGSPSTDSSGPIRSALEAFFETSGWPVDAVDKPRPALQSEFEGEDDTWMCYAIALEEADQALFYSVYPDAVPQDRLGAVAEFITRVNFDLPIGNFELGLDTGELRMKTSIDVADDDVSVALVRNLVTANVVVMNRYVPGLRRVAFEHEAPVDVLRDLSA
ncbi:YbjN domain-containing protein [Longibacter salinarum]|nr:YbjN domain-containing protein [Longibacter salinarum]